MLIYRYLYIQYIYTGNNHIYLLLFLSVSLSFGLPVSLSLTVPPLHPLAIGFGLILLQFMYTFAKLIFVSMIRGSCFVVFVRFDYKLGISACFWWSHRCVCDLSFIGVYELVLLYCCFYVIAFIIAGLQFDSTYYCSFMVNGWMHMQENLWTVC